MRAIVTVLALILSLSAFEISDSFKPKNSNDTDETTPYKWERVATGLNHPWSVDFLPNGEFLVSERSGNLRVITADGKIKEPILGLPNNIVVRSQGGLLDIKLSPNFDTDSTVYLCYAGDKNGVNSTELAKAKLNDNYTKLENLEVIFTQSPKVSSNLHFGCRIVFEDKETLFLTLGDRYSYKEEAQNLSSHLGKVVRIKTDGSIPADNPFVDNKKAKPEIYSYGHRNIQGALLKDGNLWINEHGPQGGDELNIIEAGKNYGWPVITYGENYGGGKIGEGTHKKGLIQPIYYWNPSIATSGMSFISTNRYGDWEGNLLVGALKLGWVSRLVIVDDKIVSEHKLQVNERVRDIKEAPNGEIYILTDQSDGSLYRLIRE